MQAQVANLSQKDMLDLAAYFSSQKQLAVKH
jgi:cytochrome c553